LFVLCPVACSEINKGIIVGWKWVLTLFIPIAIEQGRGYLESLKGK
jgi:hypothetical protein